MTWTDPRIVTAAAQVRFSGEQFDDDLNQFVLGAYGVMDVQVSRADHPRAGRLPGGRERLRPGVRHGRTPIRLVGWPRTVPRRAAHRAALRRHARQEQAHDAGFFSFAALALGLSIVASGPGPAAHQPAGLEHADHLLPHRPRRQDALHRRPGGRRCAGKIAGSGMVEQLEQVLKNLQTALKSQGADFSHVTKITIYTTDVEAFRAPDAAAVRARYFGATPAREHPGRRGAAGLARVQGGDRGDGRPAVAGPRSPMPASPITMETERTAGACADGILDSSRARRQSGCQRRVTGRWSR